MNAEMNNRKKRRTRTLLSVGLAAALSAAVPAAAIAAPLANPTATSGAPVASAQESIDPILGNEERVVGGFNVPIINYDNIQYRYEILLDPDIHDGTPATAEIVEVEGGGAYVAVRGLQDGEFGGFYIVTITVASPVRVSNTLYGYGNALNAAWDPTFGDPVPTVGGFEADILNLPPGEQPYEFFVTGDAPNQSVYDSVSATINWQSGKLVVTGMAPSLTATVQLVTPWPGVALTGSGAVTGTSSDVEAPTDGPALNLEHIITDRYLDGFDFTITNYDSAFDIIVDVDSATFPGVTVTQDAQDPAKYAVRGTGRGQSVDIDYFTAREGYASGAGSFTGTSLEVEAPAITVTQATAGTIDFNVNNFDALATYSAQITDSSGNNVTGTSLSPVGDAGGFQVTGVPSIGTYTLTVTAAASGASQTTQVENVSVTSGEALVPQLEVVDRNGGGFTVLVTNFDANWAWDASSADLPAGAQITQSGDKFIVSGLQFSETATIAVTASRALYLNGSSDIVGSALDPITLEFGASQPTDGGFTAQANYWPSTDTAVVYAVDIVDENGASLSEAAAVFSAETGLLTVTGLADGATATAVVSATKDGFTSQAAQVEGSALNSAVQPALSTATPTADGFVAQITNYSELVDAGFDVVADAGGELGSAGATPLVTVSTDGVVTVAGLSPEESATVFVATSQAGYKSGQGSVSATALKAGLNIEFGQVTRLKNSFRVQLVNLPADANQFMSLTGEWVITDSNGEKINGAFGSYSLTDGWVRVQGLPAGTTATLNGYFKRTGHATTTFEISGQALSVEPTPVVSDPYDITTTGFTFNIENYNPNATYSPFILPVSPTVSTAARGILNKDTGVVTVTGGEPGDSIRVNLIAETRGESEFSQTTFDASFLKVGVDPEIISLTSYDRYLGFVILNYDPEFTWEVNWTSDSGESGTAEVIPDVTGVVGNVDIYDLPIDSVITATVTTSKDGHETFTRSVSGATDTGMPLNIITGDVTRTAGGFTAPILNTDDLGWTYTAEFDSATTTRGDLPQEADVTVDAATKTVVVTGLPDGYDAGVIITAERPKYDSSSSTIQGRTLEAAQHPILGEVANLPTVAGTFTVPVLNYGDLLAAGFTVDVDSDSGAIAMDASGVITVSGLADGAQATVSTVSRKDGHRDGTDSTVGVSPMAGLVFATTNPVSNPGGFTADIVGFDPNYTFTVVDVAVMAGSTSTPVGSVDQNGVVTVTGLTQGETATVTIEATRDGYLTTSALASGASAEYPTVEPTGYTQSSAGFTYEFPAVDSNLTYQIIFLGGPQATKVSIRGSVVSVTGLNPGETVDLSVALRDSSGALVSQTNYLTGSALEASGEVFAPTPELSEPSHFNRSFGFKIVNFDESFTYSVTVDDASLEVTVDGDSVIVSGLAPGAAATATVEVSRTGYTSTSTTLTGTSAPFASVSGALTSEVGGFWATAEVPAGTVVEWSEVSGYPGSITVIEGNRAFLDGLTPGQTSRVNVRVTYPDGSFASRVLTGKASVAPALIPTLVRGDVQANSVEAIIGTLNPLFTYTASATIDGVAAPEGSVSLDGNIVRVTPIGKGNASVVITVKTSRSGVQDGTSSITIATPARPVPNIVMDSSGASPAVVVTNFDNYFTYQYTVKVNGSVVPAELVNGRIALTGTQSGDSVTVQMTVSGTGYTSGSRTVTLQVP